MQALEETELFALRAIFPQEELSIESVPPDHVSLTLFRLPKGIGAKILVDLSSYPSTAAVVELEGLRRAESLEIGSELRELANSLVGDAMLFQLVNRVKELFQPAKKQDPVDGEEVEDIEDIEDVSPALGICKAPKGVEVTHGPLEVEKKSVFQAHVSRISCVEQVKEVIELVLALPRVRRATHNMYAYRITTPSGAVFADNDDDGESGAGSKLAELLKNMDVSGGLVVVSRWYGGIPLGPSRFAIIANCARKALQGIGLEGRKQ